MYAIKCLCHRTDINMGRHGFIIDLHPDLPKMVKHCGLTQKHIEQHLTTCGRQWLDCTGFDLIFDPDNCGFEKDKELSPGPNARPSYQPNQDLRVTWGAWGIEHISVPGNACGLDLDNTCGCTFSRGVSLTPHNIDSLYQKYLLLITFTEIMNNVFLFQDKPVAPI